MKIFRSKPILIALSLFLLAGVLFGCKEQTTTTEDIIVETEAIIPQISHPDTVFFSGGGLSITYGDLYRDFKINDGINQLMMMVDALLLTEHLAAVTTPEIVDKRNLMTYGLSDADLIESLTAEDRAEREAKYQDSLFLAGYADDDEPYLRLLVAKDRYAKQAMLAEANASKSWFVGPSKVASHYTSNYDKTMKAIKIRFTSETDAKEVMRSLNLVGRSGGKLYRYIGDRPISEIPSSGFNDTNTVLLEGEELIEAFIEMYNAVYGGYRTPLAADASYEDLLANPDLVIEHAVQSLASTTLTTLMFTTFATYADFLESATTTAYYTNNPVKHYSANDTSYYMFLNLKRADKVDLSGFAGTRSDLETLIGADVYAQIEAELIATNLKTSQFVNNRLMELRKEQNFHIYDYYLGIDYLLMDYTYEPDEVGHETNLARIGETIITADEFFTYAMTRSAPLNLLYAAQMPYLIHNYYAGMYCRGEAICEYDLEANASPAMELHREALADLKAAYMQSSYVNYYSFEEYIYMAYGATSEAEMLELYYAKSALQPYAIFDFVQADSWKLLEEYLFAKVEEAYDKYFSLNVNHLLLFVDRNEDGTPDDYPTFVASQADAEAYAGLLEDFQAAIIAYMNESTANTFATLVAAYNRAKRTDATWGRFKDFGFFMITENLSASGSLTYANSKDVYATAFVDGMIAAYKEYNLPANIAKTKFLYETFVATGYGTHLMQVTKGTAFTIPTAAFTMTYDGTGQPNFTPGTENSETTLSLAQLKIHAEYRFLEMIFGTDADFLAEMEVTLPKIPENVKTAIQTFFGDVYDGLYVVGTLNAIIAEIMQSGAIVDSDSPYTELSTTMMQEALARLREIYFSQVFTGYEPSDT